MTNLHKGHLLLEILVAMGVMSVIGATIFMANPKYIDRAFDSRRKNDLERIRVYLEAFFDQHGAYPETLPECGDDQVPCDPVTRTKYFYFPHKDSGQYYRLYTILANKEDSSIEKVGCTNGCGNNCAYNYGISSPNTYLTTCDVYYVCAPGSGKEGACEIFEDPVRSKCPKVYKNKPGCNNECTDPKNRCKNSSGKNVPELPEEE